MDSLSESEKIQVLSSNSKFENPSLSRDEEGRRFSEKEKKTIERGNRGEELCRESLERDLGEDRMARHLRR